MANNDHLDPRDNDYHQLHGVLTYHLFLHRKKGMKYSFPCPFLVSDKEEVSLRCTESLPTFYIDYWDSLGRLAFWCPMLVRLLALRCLQHQADSHGLDVGFIWKYNSFLYNNC